MNLPNRLTVMRLFAVPFFLVFTVMDNVYTRLLALVIFIAAGVTDLVDGYLARRYNLVTSLGVFLDPLADKLIITAAFISFVELRELHIPAWMVILIVGREFLITGLRAVAASRGRIVAADDGGKFKTSVQNTAIITTLIGLIVTSALDHFCGYTLPGLVARGGWRADAARLLEWTPYWLTFAATLFSVLTGAGYLRKHGALLEEEARA